MAHVLLLSIGPVQPFIAAARRCRDLWFGSWLLSELAKAAALGIARTPGCGPGALVFPHAGSLDDLAPASALSVANKIVARLPDGVDPRSAALAGIAGLRERLGALRDDAYRGIRADAQDEPLFRRDIAEAQVDDLIDCAFASAPEANDGGYAGARRKAEELLAARKATKLWGRVTWGDEIPKSSLDGERESVLHEELFQRVRNGSWTPEDLRRRYGVGRAERLCGVGLLKRHGVHAKSHGQHHRFLSTPHLAAWPLLARLARIERARAAAAWNRYLSALKGAGAALAEVDTALHRHPVTGHFDGQLLFEARLDERFDHLPADQRKPSSRQAREALRGFLRELGLAAPLPYFALLVADGDRMGDLIERQAAAEPHGQAHARLSQALARFAGEAHGIIESAGEPGGSGGELVYAGGDDVLAFLPLHRAVACARTLSARFTELLSPFAGAGASAPTLSAGIAIAHFMTPMGHALQMARHAEQIAKQQRGALALVVAKRSGPPVTVCGPWSALADDLDALVALHRNNDVPDGVAFELLDLERLRDGLRGAEEQAMDTLIRRETRRILGRKHPGGGTAPLREETLDRLLASPAALARRLLVARLLAQAEDIAGVPVPARPTPPTEAACPSG